MTEYLDSAEDMQWLRDVHGITARAAVITGNMDWPTRVEAYDVPEPLASDPASVYVPDESGKMRLDYRGHMDAYAPRK